MSGRADPYENMPFESSMYLPFLLRRMSPLLAPNGHADPVERCPLLGPKRKTSTRSDDQKRHLVECLFYAIAAPLRFYTTKTQLRHLAAELPQSFAPVPEGRL
jgi:hypothetical protein